MRNRLLYLFNLILDNDRKSFIHMIKDLYKLKNKGYIHYFTNLMYKKNAGDINNYLSRSELLAIINNLYRINGKHPVLQNKSLFKEFMEVNNIPIAKPFGKIEKGKLFIFESDEQFLLTNYNSLFQILKEKISNNVFIKQVDGEGGKSVFKFYINKENSFKIDLNYNYTIEYEIKQHKYLSEINPYCVNTLRVISVNYNGKISIPDAFFRMGTGKSYVDNGSSGGIFTQYNIYTNELDKVAYKLIESGGYSYYKHPTTGFVFAGKKLPYPEKVINLIKETASLFPELKVVGWDVVYTEEGPIILEGNDNSHIGMMQISVKGLLSNEIYREVFKPYYKG